MTYIRIDHLHPVLQSILSTLINQGAPVSFNIRGDDEGYTFLNMRYPPSNSKDTQNLESDIKKGDYRLRSANQCDRDSRKLKEWQKKVDNSRKTLNSGTPQLSPIPQLDGEYDTSLGNTHAHIKLFSPTQDSSTQIFQPATDSKCVNTCITSENKTTSTMSKPV